MHKGFRPSSVIYQGSHVLVGVEGVFPGQAFVIGIAPIAATAGQGILRKESAVCVAWDGKAGVVQRRGGRVPVVPPIAGAREVFTCVGGIALSAGDLVESEIVGGVFYGSGNGAGVGWGNVIIFEPVREGAAALLGGGVRSGRVIVVGGLDFGVFEHGEVAGCPIYGASDTFNVGVCEHVVRIGTAFAAAVKV